ncbi:methyltransferase domain-containing protein [Winogradskyella psychrotolerans]|uniref:methyltransferase domain-containing protein n=1 Tax=Winogradskyella psychrotolerans TaxID=1344585 RepID=UPI002090062B|nr:methyltransferase domain-containing protein [Winogradskyella psychrotolerans]
MEKNEFFLRRLISVKYKGNNLQCNICNFNLDRFIELDDKDLLCPRCGSRSRTRRLYKLLNEKKILNGTVLHFSPPRALSEQLKKLDTINYYSSDFENEFIADYNYDITAIACESDFFDAIICYHVLEHIEDDTKAMSELFRVLKPNGICLIQTPFKEGDIYEDYSITTKSARKIAFGQDDHVRVYSVEGLRNRLEAKGFKVDIASFDSNTKDIFGLQPETVMLVKK